MQSSWLKETVSRCPKTRPCIWLLRCSPTVTCSGAVYLFEVSHNYSVVCQALYIYICKIHKDLSYSNTPSSTLSGRISYISYMNIVSFGPPRSGWQDGIVWLSILCRGSAYVRENKELWNGGWECWVEASKATGESKQGSVKLASSQIGLKEESHAP